MHTGKLRVFNHFCVVGLNHWNTPLPIRERFSIPKSKMASLLSMARANGVESVMILSTCNRTEIYANARDPDILLKIFTQASSNKKDFPHKYFYTKKDDSAMQHLFEVAAGLDSQILGDSQIVSQIKESYRISHEMNVLDPTLDRLVQIMFKTCKRIKNETALSSGTASIAYAAVQHLKINVPKLQTKRILLYGLGKIGMLACKNLLKVIPVENIAAVNRTYQKAQKVAKTLGILALEHSLLNKAIRIADIVIVATGSGQPTITDHNLDAQDIQQEKIILDLSMPGNVRISQKYNHIHVIGLDSLKDMQNASLEKRRQSIPAAKRIIREGIDEFYAWMEKQNFYMALVGELGNTIFHNGLENPFEDDSLFIRKISEEYLKRVS